MGRVASSGSPGALDPTARRGGLNNVRRAMNQRRTSTKVVAGAIETGASVGKN
jgi:hypothetical protein